MLDFIFSIFQVFWYVIAVGMVCTTVGFLYMVTVVSIQDSIERRRMDKLEKEFFQQIEEYRNEFS